MHLLPEDTFIYDEIHVQELERQFDLIRFYNEVDVGITLEQFNLNKRLKPFVPVATYDYTDAESRH